MLEAPAALRFELGLEGSIDQRQAAVCRVADRRQKSRVVGTSSICS
jgi:hypothetical protein